MDISYASDRRRGRRNISDMAVIVNDNASLHDDASLRNRLVEEPSLVVRRGVR